MDKIQSSGERIRSAHREAVYGEMEMSNTIQIKRGIGKPDGKLAPYELGYDTNGGFLYIGGTSKLEENVETGEQKVVYGNAIPVNAFRARYLIDDNQQIIRDLGNDKIPVYVDSSGNLAPCQNVLSTSGGKINGNLTITGTLSVGGDTSQGPSSGVRINSAEILGELVVNGTSTLNNALVGREGYLWGYDLPNPEGITPGTIFFKIS